MRRSLRTTELLAQRLECGGPCIELDQWSAQYAGSDRAQGVDNIGSLCGEGHDPISGQDSGPDLPKDIAAKLFQPFVPTKDDEMGVGLPICRTIVEAHGGRTWFEPGRSGGTVFHCTIPAATGVYNMETRRPALATEPSGPLPLGTNARLGDRQQQTSSCGCC